MSAQVTLSRVDPSGVEVEIAVFSVARFALVCRDRLQAGVSAKRVFYRVTDDEGREIWDVEDLVGEAAA